MITSINVLSRRFTLPQFLNASGKIIPATTALMIHAVYWYPFNDGTEPKPIARQITVANAQGLYINGCCTMMPITRTTANKPETYKKYFFIQRFTYSIKLRGTP